MLYCVLLLLLQLSCGLVVLPVLAACSQTCFQTGTLHHSNPQLGSQSQGSRWQVRPQACTAGPLQPCTALYSRAVPRRVLLDRYSRAIPREVAHAHADLRRHD